MLSTPGVQEYPVSTDVSTPRVPLEVPPDYPCSGRADGRTMRVVAVQHETLQTASCRSVALRAPCVSTPSTGVSTPSTDVSTPSTPSGAGRADGVVPRLAEALFGGVAERRGQARVPGEY